MARPRCVSVVLKPSVMLHQVVLSVTWLTGATQHELGSMGGVFERDAAGEIEAADDDCFRVAQSIDRGYAEAARNDPICANSARERSQAFLLQLIRGALVIAAGSKY